MKREISGDHPLRMFFSETLHQSMSTHLGLSGLEDVESYLAGMLVEFLNFDGIYAIRNAQGKRVESLVEMLAEGDIRLNANSFDREREVHRHVGDFLLFWSGLFPEFLMKAGPKDGLVDAVRQGQFSYYVVSTFEHGEYANEAGTFRRLSIHFDDFRTALNGVRTSFKGLPGWEHGFDA